MKLDQISQPEETKEFYFFSWLLHGATFKETKLSQEKKKTVLKAKPEIPSSFARIVMKSHRPAAYVMC